MYRGEVKRAFIVFHLTLAIVILVLSVATAVHAAGIRADTSPNWHLFALATGEAIAAVLFVLPWTTRLGGGVLIAILLIAFLAHALEGDHQLALLVYAAGTYLVVRHGNAMGRPANRGVRASGRALPGSRRRPAGHRPKRC